MLAPAAPTWQRLLLRLLAATPLGRVTLVSSAATASCQQYEDPLLLAEVERDPLRCREACPKWPRSSAAGLQGPQPTWVLGCSPPSRGEAKPPRLPWGLCCHFSACCS